MKIMLPISCDCSSFAGEVYILASSKSMAQSHSGKLYKLVDPKRYMKYIVFFSGGGGSHWVGAFSKPYSFSHLMFVDSGGIQSGLSSISK